LGGNEGGLKIREEGLQGMEGRCGARDGELRGMGKHWEEGFQAGNKGWEALKEG
jgi:hypothetical protein